MHLLLVRKGVVFEADEAVDLGQSPADILFLSAADTELSSVAAAKRLLGSSVPTLRLANVITLSHPMSVDTYCLKTARFAHLIVVRILGGLSYWCYGLESLFALATQYKINLAVLPGDDKPDPSLMNFSTLDSSSMESLWHYLLEGGEKNAKGFLQYCAFILKKGKQPPLPAPLVKAGLWWPDKYSPTLEELRFLAKIDEKPVVPIIFYRALVQSGQTEPVKALLEALQTCNLAPLPIFVSGLKDTLSIAVLSKIFSTYSPALILNATGFATAKSNEGYKTTVLEKYSNMVLQVVFSSSNQIQWEKNTQGLSAREVAMNVSLPEIDGRVFSRAVSFKAINCYDSETECVLAYHKPILNRINFVARLASNWIILAKKKPKQRRIAVIMANYPGGDGRLGHGVGLDTPESVIVLLKVMKKAGYKIQSHIPQNGENLIHLLVQGPTNEGIKNRIIRITLSLSQYWIFFKRLPQKNRKEILERWGDPRNDPYVIKKAFALPVLCFGNIVVALQPERAFGMAVKQVYHAADIVPSHHYMAFYFWLRFVYRIDAIVHMGKHGNLEWLPGKALALSKSCYPELALGPLPHVYPFIVNDPGEGSQAKRRSSAVIIDHMTPPLTRAESYGHLKDLETLVDEYYEAAAVDPRRLVRLKEHILDLAKLAGIDKDAGIEKYDKDDLALQKLDSFLCDLKEMQIRDGLHIFGVAPKDEQLVSLLVALARVPGTGNKKDSLHRAIVQDLQLYLSTSQEMEEPKRSLLDPLDFSGSEKWYGARPPLLLSMSDSPWRSVGDTVERIENLCIAFVSGNVCCPEYMVETKRVLKNIKKEIRPKVLNCGRDEITSFLSALDGHFIPPGPSGAPTRGRLDVLPTGRNFFSLDNRTIPTPVAWDLGFRSAELLITRYVQDHGHWPSSFGLTVWGTSNMRTGGDDIAQALALIGVKPVWDGMSRRVTGYEIIPLARLGRPRIDVMLRISGFFRDSFPEQLILLDQAFRAVGALDESAEDNPAAERMQRDTKRLQQDGILFKDAQKQAGYRIFGSSPGVYGTGVQELINSGKWKKGEDFGRAWIAFSSYAYDGKEIKRASTMLEKRLQEIESVIQNQDNYEHDLLDSGEYYAFEGGMASAIMKIKGEYPSIYHNDLSRPERPIIRPLEREIGRIIHGRVVNPKWIASAMRHGYRGGAEMAATVDYLFSFAATTGTVSDAHFNAIYNSWMIDDTVRNFLQTKNHAALCEIAQRLEEAINRNIWKPYSNSARFFLKKLKKEKSSDQ